MGEGNFLIQGFISDSQVKQTNKKTPKCKDPCLTVPVLPSPNSQGHILGTMRKDKNETEHIFLTLRSQSRSNLIDYFHCSGGNANEFNSYLLTFWP